MLRIGLAHVAVVGAWDRRIARWLLGKDSGTIASIASWLRRAWKEGHTAGRVEAVEESGDLRAQLDRVIRQLATLSADVQQVAADLAKAAAPVAEGQDATAPIAGRLLAAVDTAVIDLADAVEHLADPPACGGCENPVCPTRPFELCPRSVVDRARAAGDRWSGAYPLPAWWDGTGDAETSCAARGWDDLTGLVQLCLRPDGHAGRHMAALTTVFAGRPPEIICAWPGTARPAESDLTDPCIDALRGYGAGGDDDHADPHFTRGSRCVCTCDRCVTRMAVPGEDAAPVCTCPDGCTCDDGIHPGADTPEDQGDDVLQPGHAIPDQPGYVVGTCGHRVAGSEWSAGYRTCERCPADDGHSTPLAAAGLAAGALGVAGLVATHSGSPGLGIVFAAVGGIAGVAVLVLGRRGPGGGAS
jgi:hypothetical protein